MPESETSKKITRIIKLADRVAQDVKKGAEELREAMKELRGGERCRGKGRVRFLEVWIRN